MKRAFLLPILLFCQFALAQPEEQPKELEEVVVEKEQRTFTVKNGDIRVDVANSVYNSVPNTIDLLSKLPKVIVSPDKQSISIAGKGNPLLYVDNQRVEMTDLNSLSVDDIKTIEILQNPSAKYEAEGRAVVLITLKFSKRQGYKVILSETASFQKYFNNYSGINANFKSGKVEFKANFNYNKLTVWESNGNTFSMADYNLRSNYLTTAVTKRPAFLYGGTVFYKICEDDYLSFTLNRRSRKDIFDVTTQTVNDDGNSVEAINTLNRSDENQDFANAFLNYSHKVRSLGINLFSGFQYSSFHQEMASIISNNYNGGGFELSQYRNQEFWVDVFSGRTDLEKKFGNEAKIEFGGLFTGAEAVTYFEVEDSNPPAVADSRYQYQEKNIAAYAQFSGSYKKFSVSAGLRAEKTIVKGKYDTENDFTIDKNYINLFPKAQVGFAIDSANSISVNYAKTISRPNFSSASQVSVYINPYLVWANNIHLDPTIIDEISIGYQFQDKTLRFAYYKISNPVYFSVSYDAALNLTTFTTTNFDKETNFNIDLTVPFKYKFWATTNVLNFSINKVEDDLAVIGKVKPGLYYYSNHNFSLPGKIQLDVTGWGLTRQKLGVFEKNALFTMNAAVSKTFFKNLDGTLSYNDIFRKMTFKENFNTNNVAARGIYYTDSTIVSLSLKYSFGRIKDTEMKERNVDENQGRIK